MNTIEKKSKEQARELQQYPSLLAVAALVILLIALLLGILYVWGSVLTHDGITQTAPTAQKPLINNEPETPRMTADVQALNTLSSSDELSAIRADLESTSLNSIDTDMQSIEAELGTFETQTR
jgi:hypothetical protein